jgi:hypothetical protein
MRSAVIVIVLGLLSGCGTIAFSPAVYPLRDGLVPSLDVAGPVTVSNAQPSTDEAIVYSYGGSKLASDLKSITETMVVQTRSELEKNGRSRPGSPKSIALKVDSLLSRYIAFYWNSKIVFQATLGNGQVLNFEVPHTSGSVHQNLNGNIAEGVMTLLGDDRVRAYLGS